MQNLVTFFSIWIIKIYVSGSMNIYTCIDFYTGQFSMDVMDKLSTCTLHKHCLGFVTVDFDSHTGTNTAITSYVLHRCNRQFSLGQTILKAPILTDLHYTTGFVTFASQTGCVFPAAPPALPPSQQKAQQCVRMTMTEPHVPLHCRCKATQ